MLKFADGSGNVAADDSGAMNTGTLSGMAQENWTSGKYGGGLS